MIGEAIAVTAIGGVIITALDHENLLGTNNPGKLFWWQRPPFAPAPTPTIRAPTPRLSPEQAFKAQQSEQLRQEWEVARRSSKYAITDHSSPSTEFVPYKK